jgi:hypothetical protein
VASTLQSLLRSTPGIVRGVDLKPLYAPNYAVLVDIASFCGSIGMRRSATPVAA